MQIAILKWKDVSLVKEPSRHNAEFKTIQTSVRRIKTESVHQGTDNCIHYVHATDIKRCYLFAMLYGLVMNSRLEPSEFMFPSWKLQVTFTKNGTQSKVSQKFSKYIGVMVGIATKYIEAYKEYENIDFDEDIAGDIDLLTLFVKEIEEKSFYMYKKHGVQYLGDSNLAPQVRQNLINFDIIFS